MYRYLALLDEPGRSRGDGRIHDALRQLGLTHRLALGAVDLYTAECTPVLSLACGGALVGHVFPREPGAAFGIEDLAGLACPHRLIKCLIDRFWGEYLLLIPPGRDDDATTVVRDPSGGVDCVYSPRDGFIASDVSIAARAGLYRRQIDWEFIRSNAVYPHHKAGATGLARLRELLPGCRLRISADRSSIEQAWSP